MAIYAISDLHLALSKYKPMDIFGTGWQNYIERIETAWRKMIRDDDTVLIPGDLSWATYIHSAVEDFTFLDALPGRKILSKGNHDYWWTTMTQMEKFIIENDFNTISFIQNNSILVDDVAIAATRGWICPGMPDFKEEDRKIYERELGRLKLSLSSLPKDPNTAEKLYNKLVVMLHYPPFSPKVQSTNFLEIIQSYEPDYCLYGHLHGEAVRNEFCGAIGKTEFLLVAADHLKFCPVRLF